MLVCGILNKCIDFEDIYDYAKEKKWFDKKLNLWMEYELQQHLVMYSELLIQSNF